MEEGLDWLTSKLSQKHKLKSSSGFGKDGAYITKLPDHDRKANLTDLTIDENGMESSRNKIKNMVDLESA